MNYLYNILCDSLPQYCEQNLMILKRKSLKALRTGSVFITCLVFASCVFAQTNGSSSGEKLGSRGKAKQNTVSAVNVKKNPEIEEIEETVIINIVNFGRKNPFRPYGKYSIVSKHSPPPPAFNSSVDSQLTELTSSRVSGILFDPGGESFAVINISGKDYMVAKNDSVFGFSVEKITKDNVTLKYGNNTYNVSVGNVISNSQIKYDPVIRERQEFGGGSYTVPPGNSNYYNGYVGVQ